MPPQIVVGIDQRDRGEDLSRNQDAFRRFLVEELVPYVDRTYRTSGFRTLIGHSLGGRFALTTFCRSPGVFPAVIAISAAGDSSGAGAATACLATAFASDTTLRQLVLSAGDREPRTLAGVERLGEFLRTNAPRNWRWTIVPGVGLGHTETPLATIPPGIHFIQDKTVWEMPPSFADSVTKGLMSPDDAVRSFYAALGKRIGSPVNPSLKWMLAAARVHIQRADGDAESAVRRVIDAYPEDLEAYGMLADRARARGDNGLARRTLTEARAMLDRLELHDVYDRERKRQLLDRALADIPR
jgi:pimeloyl-ACP methyl ester carboxylesterase